MIALKRSFGKDQIWTMMGRGSTHLLLTGFNVCDPDSALKRTQFTAPARGLRLSWKTPNVLEGSSKGCLKVQKVYQSLKDFSQAEGCPSHELLHYDASFPENPHVSPAHETPNMSKAFTKEDKWQWISFMQMGLRLQDVESWSHHTFISV